MEKLKFTVTDIPTDIIRGVGKYEPMAKALLENPGKALSVACLSKKIAIPERIKVRMGVKTHLDKVEKKRWRVITRIVSVTIYIWLERRNSPSATKARK